MLPTVKGSQLSALPVRNGRLIADLIHFDGPLLSYYQDDHRGHYLYYWCDADDTFHRWLVVQIEEHLLRAFLIRQITLRRLFLRVARNKSFLLDTDSDGKPAQIVRVEMTDLPEEYLPTEETWYDASLSVFYDHLAARELMSMLQDSLLEVQSKLKRIEQILSTGPESLEQTPVAL